MPPVGAEHRSLWGGWLSFNPLLVCFSSLPVPSVPVRLLPGAQRGAVQAAAQAGAAAALLAAAGAAEGQVAPAGPRPAPFLPPQTRPAPPAPSASSGQDLMDTALPSTNKPTNHERRNKKPPEGKPDGCGCARAGAARSPFGSCRESARRSAALPGIRGGIRA